MNLDLNIGDIILGGRFKNKRIEVKSLGTDELGQPIVNKSRKLLAVRIEKLLPKKMQSFETQRREMEKKAILQETYNSAFNDELEKIAESNKKISHAKNIGTGLGASIVAGIPQSTIGLGVMARLKNQQPSFDEYTVNRKQTKDPNILKLRKNMNIDTPVYTRSAPAIKGGGGIYMPIKGNSLAEQGAHIWTKNKSGIATPFETAMMSHE